MYFKEDNKWQIKLDVVQVKIKEVVWVELEVQTVNQVWV